jgi:hypothetical protein
MVPKLCMKIINMIKNKGDCLKNKVFSHRSIFQLVFKIKEKNALCGGNVP